MGLELLVTAEDVISLFTTDRELLLSALRERAITSIKDRYSLNIYRNPLSYLAGLKIGHLPDYLTGKFGNDYTAIFSTVRSAIETAEGLLAFLVNNEGNIDELTAKHIAELGKLKHFHDRISALNDVPEESTTDVQHCKEGICKVIIRANMMYNPATRKGFLSHVSEGMPDYVYEQKLIAPFIDDAAAKTL